MIVCFYKGGYFVRSSCVIFPRFPVLVIFKISTPNEMTTRKSKTVAHSQVANPTRPTHKTTTQHLEEKNELIFRNLKLLGYTFPAGESINPQELFKVSTPKRFEDTCYFLFKTLYPDNVQLLITAWPITNRKEKSLFYKECHIALKEISKHQDVKFPSFGPTVLLSAGGTQFTNLYLAFSSYVLQKTLVHLSQDTIPLSYPKLSPREPWKNSLVKKSLEGALQLALREFIQVTRKASEREVIFREWMSQQTQDFRANKAQQELKTLLTDHDTELKVECGFSADDIVDLDDIINKQKTVLKEVCGMWNEFSELQKTVSLHVDKIKEGLSLNTSEKLVIDATLLDLTVPPDRAGFMSDLHKEMVCLISELKKKEKYNLKSLISVASTFSSVCERQLEECVGNGSDLKTAEEDFYNFSEAHKLLIKRLKTLVEKLQNLPEASIVCAHCEHNNHNPDLKLLYPLPPLCFSPDMKVEILSFDESVLGSPCFVSSLKALPLASVEPVNESVKGSTNVEDKLGTPGLASCDICEPDKKNDINMKSLVTSSVNNWPEKHMPFDYSQEAGLGLDFEVSPKSLCSNMFPNENEESEATQLLVNKSNMLESINEYECVASSTPDRSNRSNKRCFSRKTQSPVLSESNSFFSKDESFVEGTSFEWLMNVKPPNSFASGIPNSDISSDTENIIFQ